MKEAYYFSHDATAQDDEKIMNLMADHGWAGYGIFWGLIEKLRSASDYRFKIKSIKGVAAKMGIEYDVLYSIIFDFELFEANDEYFWSPSLNRRMELRDSKIEQARTAGQRSGEVRRTKMNYRSTDVQQTFNDSSTEDEQGKERKGKESINTITTTTTTTNGENAEVVENDFDYEIQEYFKKRCPPGSNPIQEAKIFIDMNSIKNWGAAKGKENWRAVADLYIRKIKVKPIKTDRNGNGTNVSKAESASNTLRKWAERKGISGTN